MGWLQVTGGRWPSVRDTAKAGSQAHLKASWKARRKERLFCVSEVVSRQFLAYPRASLSLAQKSVRDTILPGLFLSSTTPKETERMCLHLKGLDFGGTGCHEEVAALALPLCLLLFFFFFPSEEAGLCGRWCRGFVFMVFTFSIGAARLFSN